MHSDQTFQRQFNDHWRQMEADAGPLVTPDQLSRIQWINEVDDPQERHARLQQVYAEIMQQAEQATGRWEQLTRQHPRLTADRQLSRVEEIHLNNALHQKLDQWRSEAQSLWLSCRRHSATKALPRGRRLSV